MQVYEFRPDVAERLKLFVKEFNDMTYSTYQDWVPRMLIWSEPGKDYIAWFRLMCGDDNGRMYAADGQYDATTETLSANPKMRDRVFIDFYKGIDIFKDALVNMVSNIVDMLTFDVDAIAVDLGVAKYNSVKVFELRDHRRCLGITAFSAEAKDDWGFKGMAKVLGEEIVNI